MQHCQGLAGGELLQVEAGVAQGEPLQTHDQTDHARVALQAQGEEISNARWVSDCLCLGGEAPTLQQHFHVGIHLQVAEPVCLRAAGGRLLVNGCEFMAEGKQQIVLEKGLKAAAITGCLLRGDKAVSDNNSGADVQMGLNTTR